MAIETQMITEENTPALIVKFTNGNIEQLDELAAFFKSEGLSIPDGSDEQKRVRIIKLGIGLLQKLKEDGDINSSNK